MSTKHKVDVQYVREETERRKRGGIGGQFWHERVLAICTEVERLSSESARRDVEIKRLREALQSLRDYQNGPPLPSYEKGWSAAMAQADAALASPATGKAAPEEDRK